MTIKTSKRLDQLAKDIKLDKLIEEADSVYNHNTKNSAELTLQSGIDIGMRLAYKTQRFKKHEIFCIKPKKGIFLYFVAQDEETLIAWLDDLTFKPPLRFCAEF